MGEVLIGVLFAFWFVTAYLLSSKALAYVQQRQNRRLDAESIPKAGRFMSGDELSAHHARGVEHKTRRRLSGKA